MEMHELNRPSSPTPKDSRADSAASAPIFEIGATVIYPMLGKCTVMSREQKTIAGESLAFYKLEVQKSSFSRSTRQDPAVWVPVAAASEKGLRAPLNAEQVPAVFQVFSSREYYFTLSKSWNLLLPELEATIRRDGALGLAKVASFLFVLKKKQVVPSPELNRYSEAVDRLLYRELSEATGDPIRVLDEKARKAMRTKLTPDI